MRPDKAPADNGKREPQVHVMYFGDEHARRVTEVNRQLVEQVQKLLTYVRGESEVKNLVRQNAENVLRTARLLNPEAFETGG